MEWVYYFYDIVYQTGFKDSSSRADEFDGSPKVCSAVWTVVCGACDRHAAYPDPVHVRAEEADPGYDTRRIERMIFMSIKDVLETVREKEHEIKDNLIANSGQSWSGF